MKLDEMWDLPFSPKSAERVARSLGPLAGYLLNDEVLRVTHRAVGGRPSLPSGPGVCWPVIAVKNEKWQSFLSPAFPLPVRWLESEQEDDARLPQTILDCAKEVRATLLEFTNHQDVARAKGFRIRFSESSVDWPDLNHLEFPADSAFASMALGFFSLLNNVSPSAMTWASVQWDNRLLPVDDLQEKVNAALRWQAESFFVAAEQAIEMLNADQRAIVKTLPAKPASPTVALGEYFVSGLVEPDPSDAAACLAYHAAVREVDRGRAVKYYAEVLFRHITEKCLERIYVSAGMPTNRPSVMVTIVTANIEPVSVIIGVLGIRKVLLLYTENESQMQMKAADLYKQIKRNWPGRQWDKPQGFHFDPESSDFPKDFFVSLQGRLSRFLNGVRDADVVFDIDRGTTMHKLALCKLIRPDQWLTTLAHRLKGKDIEHGTERLMLWRSGDDWTRPFCHLNASPEADGLAE